MVKSKSHYGSGVCPLARKDPEDLRYVYPMSVVERMTGLTRRRIRYYEQAGLLAPRRTEGGHRLYSPENVDMLRRVKALIDRGIGTMESVRRMIEAGLDTDMARRPERDTSPIAGSRLPQRDLGDAAIRVMRPVEPRFDAAGRPGETDSRSFFRRATVIQRQAKDTRNR